MANTQNCTMYYAYIVKYTFQVDPKIEEHAITFMYKFIKKNQGFQCTLQLF